MNFLNNYFVFCIFFVYFFLKKTKFVSIIFHYWINQIVLNKLHILFIKYVITMQYNNNNDKYEN